MPRRSDQARKRASVCNHSPIIRAGRALRSGKRLGRRWSLRKPGGPWPAKPRLSSRSSLLRRLDTRGGAAHNCDALLSKHTGLPVTSSGRDYDHAEQVSWINSNYRDTRPDSAGRGSADQPCACRLPRFTEFACPEWQLVVLPIGLAYATQMLVFACARKAGETNGGTGDNRVRSSRRVQGLLDPSQHDQVMVLTIALHLCLPLTPHRSAQLCKKYPLLKQAPERRSVSRPRPPRKMMRQ